ncbi:uncharacterized protein LOC119090695 [Pollicipes pollicipes]|uniref:uncharacterized protein LOC119090695 n=1 Tax=Pollicipes pollicipes TaxID=41117 RepID=UPI001884B441|nr:uncharacterized protein LOC119090695 [Pollicipes pollicipes]
MTELQWAAGSGGSVPEGAVSCEGAYVGRAHHDNGIIIGPVVCADSCCAIGYCGERFTKDEYEVLLEPTDGKRLRWEKFTGDMPEGAVKGGYLCSGHPLYVGRTWKDGKLLIGHINNVHKVCCVPSEDKCYDCSDFYVLVAY